jgi:hypothetical protein
VQRNACAGTTIWTKHKIIIRVSDEYGEHLKPCVRKGAK